MLICFWWLLLFICLLFSDDYFGCVCVLCSVFGSLFLCYCLFFGVFRWIVLIVVWLCVCRVVRSCCWCSVSKCSMVLLMVSLWVFLSLLSRCEL